MDPTLARIRCFVRGSAICAAALALGCAHEAPPPIESPTDEAAQASPAPPPAAAPAPPVPTGKPGVIARGELERVLSESPGAFLAKVETQPAFDGTRFRGWRLNSFFPNDDRFRGVDLHTGDVITRVNGQPVEQPEQFIQVWEGARFRHDLTVDLFRDGKPRHLAWTIGD
jgi:type II secretory pathway component PulC